MKKNVYLSIVCALAINAAASDLGTIQVESSTIDDKFESTKGEVSNVVVVDAKEIEKINPTNVFDILNTIPGVTASNTGNDIVKIHIRGVDNHMYMGEKPGVAIVIDGVPVQETSGKINVDLDNIETIKVIKGSASYLFGNDALAGAVVITTKRAKAKSSTKAEFEAGSFGSFRMLTSTNQSFDNSAIQIQASSRDTDGYWDDAYLHHKSINGKYSYYIDDSSDIVFGLDYTTRKTGDGNSVKGLTEAINNPKSVDYLSYSGYYDSDLLKAFATYSNDIDASSNFMVSLHSYTDDKTNLTARGAQRNDEKWMQNGIKGEYRKSINNFAFMTGVDIHQNTTDDLSFETVDDNLTADYDTEENINAIYAELKYQITKDLTTTVNGRYDDLRYKYKDYDDSANDVSPSYNAFSYRAGLNYTVNKNASLYTSVSTGFRAPTVGQISKNKQGIADGYAVPAELDPETTINYELGLRGSSYGFNYDLAVYQLDRNDYIGRQGGSYISSSGWGAVSDTDEDEYYFNLGDMRSRGLELGLNSDRKKELSFSMAYTYLDATFEEYSITRETGSGNETVDLAGNTVPRTSKHTVNLILDYKPLPALTISPELIAKSSYYADEANNFKQDGYEVVNLRANYQVTKDIELFAKIDNLLDTNYYTFVTLYSSDVSNTLEDATYRVAATRSYYAGMRMRF